MGSKYTLYVSPKLFTAYSLTYALWNEVEEQQVASHHLGGNCLCKRPRGNLRLPTPTGSALVCIKTAHRPPRFKEILNMRIVPYDVQCTIIANSDLSTLKTLNKDYHQEASRHL
jgi:hypothetical protein